MEPSSPKSSWLAQTQRFCHQYLQLEPDLDYPKPSELCKAETQERLFATLFADGAQPYLPPQRYQVRVLKELIRRIEESIGDWEAHGLSDNLMSSLSGLLSTPQLPEATAVQQKCYVTYHLAELQGGGPGWSPQVTLLENRSLISAAGTTGLRTWEAALHLGRYLCRNREIIRGKRVLELGAGTGYVSILCAKHLGAAHSTASDGSDDVINNLPTNFFLNDLQSSHAITTMDLKWGHALAGTEEKEWNGGRPVDVILGADIVYDQRVTPALLATLEDLTLMFPRAKVIISSTERNRATFDSFLALSSGAGFIAEAVDLPASPRSEQLGPFYSNQLPIHICHLCRS